MNKYAQLNLPYEEYPHDFRTHGGGDAIVDTAGFIPKDTQLQILLDSGKSLDDYLKKLYPGYYDPATEQDNPSENPTVKKDFDIFDAIELGRNVNDNMRATEQQHKQEQKEAYEAYVEALQQNQQKPAAGTSPPVAVAPA